MTAIALPRPRKQKSKPAQLAKNAARAWTAIKIIKVMPGKPAKKGAVAVATYKVVSFVRKGGKKLIVIPIAAGGGLAAYKKLRSSGEEEPATPYGSPVGPVATPATVTPPKTAPGANVSANGVVDDPGATTPAGEPGSAS
jgi:hypothetical protein